MKNPFKQVWKNIVNKAHPPEIDRMEVRFLINDLTERMASAVDFMEWRNLYHEREGLQIQHDYMPVEQ